MNVTLEVWISQLHPVTRKPEQHAFSKYESSGVVEVLESTEVKPKVPIAQ